MKNLRVWQKAVIIAIAFSVPIVVLLYFLVSEQGIAIDFGTNERKGLEYLAPADKLLVEVQQHRDFMAAALGGDASFKDRVTAKEAEIEASFNALGAQEKKFGAAFKTSAEFNALRQSWQDLKGAGAKLRPEQSFARHNKLIYDVLHIIIRAGNSSQLVLDPDVDSYYAMDACIFKLPKLMEDVSQARGFGAGLLAKGGEISAADKASLASMKVRIEESLREMNDNIQYGLEANQRMSSTLKPAIEYSVSATNEFLDQLDKKILTGQTPQVTTGDYFSAATKAMDVNVKLADSQAVVLDDLLKARIDRFNQQRLISFVAVGLSLIVTFLFLVFIVRSITRPIAHLTMVAERISLGEMDAKIDIDSTEDIGELAQKFRRLQVSLKAAMDQVEGQEGDKS